MRIVVGHQVWLRLSCPWSSSSCHCSGFWMDEDTFSRDLSIETPHPSTMPKQIPHHIWTFIRTPTLQPSTWRERLWPRKYKTEAVITHSPWGQSRSEMINEQRPLTFDLWGRTLSTWATGWAVLPGWADLDTSSSLHPWRCTTSQRNNEKMIQSQHCQPKFCPLPVWCLF